MSYHPLANESGSDSTARRAEADKLVDIIENSAEYLLCAKANERLFIANVKMGVPITTKMLFWLRDIKDKYL